MTTRDISRLTLTALSARNGVEPANGRFHVPRRVSRLTAECLLGLGGYGAQVVAECRRVNPALPCFLADTDNKSLNDLPAGTDAMVLRTDGHFPSILANKDLYPFLRGPAVPDRVGVSEVEEGIGVGLTRPLAGILLGANLDEVKRRLRTWLGWVLRRLAGSGAKRLVVHLVFSLCGGSGSALAVHFAALVRDAARSLIPSLSVVVVGHVVGAGPFLDLLSTPLEQQKALANQVATLAEITYLQDPANQAELMNHLAIEPIGRPLFNDLCYGDSGDSSDCVQSISQLGDRFAVNVIAQESHALQLVQASREVNLSMGLMAVRGTRASTAIASAVSSAVLRAPVAKLVAAVAARVASATLATATRPADPAAVRSSLAAVAPVLSLEQLRRQFADRLASDEYQLPPPGRMTPEEYLAADRVIMDVRWAGRGRTELAHKARRLGGEFDVEVPQIGREFLSAAQDRCGSVPEYRAVLDRALEGLKEAVAAERQELERLAAADPESARARARADLERLGRLGRALTGGGRKARLRAASASVVRAAIETAARRGYLDAVLNPLQASVAIALQAAERVEQALAVNRRVVEAGRERAEAEIGYANADVDEVVTPAEVGGVLGRLEREVTGWPGGEFRLTLLLATRGDEELVDLLQRVAARAADDCRDHLFRACRDVKGFIAHFGLGLDLDGWLTDRLELTLPAKLNLAACGPGATPLRGYLVAPSSLRSTCQAAVAATPDPARFEIVPADDDPFEVIVRGKVSRVPLAGLPGWAAAEAAFRRFQVSAPRDQLWGHLASHGCLIPALELVGRMSSDRAA